MAQNWHNEYADRKNGRKPVTFDHPDLEEILGPTFGLMIYQEQLMRVSQKLAGYSLEEADNLRKATGKKIRELIAKERGKFVDGCVRNGHTAEFAERYFDTIEPFADYSFNKSHSVGYGFVTYQTAWLKANHPVPYLAALLTSVKSNLDKAAVYLNECRQRDDPVLVPDVNASASDFACELAAVEGEQDAIRFGLSAVRNVGEGVSRADHRGARADGSVRRLLRLLRARRPERAQQAHDRVVDQGGRLRLARPSAQGSAARVRADRRRDAAPPPRARPGHDEPLRPRRRRRRRQPGVRRPARRSPTSSSTSRERLRAEKEMLGLYVSDHPLMGAESVAAALRRVLDRRPDRARRRLDAHGRRRRHRRSSASTPSAATSWPRSCSRTSAAAIEVMVFPKTMLHVRRAPRRRRDRRDQGPGRRPRRHAEAHGDGDHPARDQPRRRPAAHAAGEGRRCSPTSGCSGCASSSPRTRATARCSCALVGPEKETVLRLGDEFRCEARNGLFAELRVLFGADCIALSSERPCRAGSPIRRRSQLVDPPMRIGILGATGPAGGGLAARLASVGHEVLFGSRAVDKAKQSVAELKTKWGDRVAGLHPCDNAWACDAPVVILAVHADSAIPTVHEHAERLQGKIVVSMANNLVKNGNEFNAVLPPHGSVAAEIQALLWRSHVCTAFHLVPAAEFADLDHTMESDVIVLGDDDDAKARADGDHERASRTCARSTADRCATRSGMETFAAVLLTVNIRHKMRASLRLTTV